MPKRYRQLQVKDFPEVPTWRLERDSNPRPSGRTASSQPMRHHVLSYYSISAWLNAKGMSTASKEIGQVKYFAITIYSLIHSRCFYVASSSPLLGLNTEAFSTTALILCRS